MDLFVTDDKEIFTTHSSGKKLFIQNSNIHASKGFDEKQIARFNFSLNAVETIAAEKMISELKEVAAKAPHLKTNKYLATRKSNYDIAYSLLYPNFKLFVLNKYIFELFIQSFFKTFSLPDTTKLEVNLSTDFKLITESLFCKELNCAAVFRKKKKESFLKPAIKNSYYLLTKTFGTIKKRAAGKNNIPHALLFIYDTANDINLFKHFVKETTEKNKIKLSIVQISSGISKQDAFDVKLLQINSSVDIYYFKDFKAPVNSTNSSFYDWAESVNPNFKLFKRSGINQNTEVYYAFAAEAIKELKPTITLYDNTGEVGRVVSDISRYCSIPSINIEYALFTDDAIHMESNIKFSARACLGTASADLWKKRNDPTPLHVPIGFLKLDGLENSTYNKELFYKKNGLDISLPTIFFASTWSAINDVYNEEKAKIITELCGLCEKNKWNLIVKKHPSERDMFANDALKKASFKRAKVFEHRELDLYEAIFYSDVVTTQFSGVSVEALYFKKPVVFINLSEGESWANLSIMKNEPYVFMCNHFAQVEEKINELLARKDHFMDSMNDGIKKFLHATDGKAAGRLTGLIEELSA